ncbi:RNA recognition motif domain-containing protein [Persicitalea sp.]|uniref:RNA recognition motif domain-containing protein n=1 Tax=Persicitalea sp. TaxID=3100273 RepID=UPI0035946096
MEIFVGSLPLTLRRWHLQEIFEKYGAVSSATVVIDYDTKQSKGYGFVKMPDRLQGLDAIASLNGREIDGVPLVVNETKYQRDEGRESRAEKPKASKPTNFSRDRYAKPDAAKPASTHRPSSGRPGFGKKSNSKKK